LDGEGQIVQEFAPPRGEQVIPTEVSESMRFMLETVVSVGTGRRTYIPGFRVGAKTSTSQKLPRGSGKYISSIMAFAPADNPAVVALVLVDQPQGVYYGWQVTGPIMQVLLENVLPYLGVTPMYVTEEEQDAAPVTVPNLRGLEKNEALELLKQAGLNHDLVGRGDVIVDQFPIPGELVNRGERILLRIKD
jgi:stage V sporulation protein D (sporulation-specific penicillin-binding protein)